MSKIFYVDKSIAESREKGPGIMFTSLVYGTLKRGHANHDRFCRGAVSIDEAIVRGRLYELPSGIPVLRVPDEDVLAIGTSEPLVDVATQARFVGTCKFRDTTGDWDWVHGELMIFDDPESRTPLIDRLEGFHPRGPSLYRRVLVPVVYEAEVVPAWCYVAGELVIMDILPTGKQTWP